MQAFATGDVVTLRFESAEARLTFAVNGQWQPVAATRLFDNCETECPMGKFAVSLLAEGDSVEVVKWALTKHEH